MVHRPASDAVAAEERRLYRRFPMAVAGTLHTAHGSFPIRLKDLSLGGAAVEPGRPELAGARVRLVVEGLDHPDGLEAKVVRATQSTLHLCFALDPAQEDALSLFLLLHADAEG